MTYKHTDANIVDTLGAHTVFYGHIKYQLFRREKINE
jgi:hypothetical protein